MGSLFWFDTLIIPAVATSISISILILSSKPARRLNALLPSPILLPQLDSWREESQGTHTDICAAVKEHVTQHGGPVIFGYMMARLIGCLTLMGLSFGSIMSAKPEMDEPRFGIRLRLGYQASFSEAQWLQFAVCSSSVYVSLLAIVSVIAKPARSSRITTHLVSILLVTASVYVYRDLWPLTTFSMRPKDRGEGPILWAKVIVLTLTAVIPLFTPRRYIPFDQKDPAPELNPEQTTPLWSLLTYSFIDPIVFLAYHIPHLSYDQLPPLADRDYAKNLARIGFPHLDPFTNQHLERRHLLFGLMRVFWRECTVVVVIICINVISGFATPIGINRLLNYLEQHGEGATVHPWVWIMWLFLGPTISAIASQWYKYIATMTLVRTEGILTQLVFEHTLRIRMKAETHDSRSSGESPASDGATRGDDLTSDNLIGKINNLVTTDLGNIVDARDFLLTIIDIPLQTVLCVWFLYAVLGWSAFVGLIVMVSLFPVPGYVAGRIHNVQVQRMKKLIFQTDARLQAVTETMNVLRMIKLLSWKSKMNEKVAKYREEELTWLWSRKMLELLNDNINSVLPVVTMLATYTTYTTIMKQTLNASKVFSSIAVFDMIKSDLLQIFSSIAKIIQGKVSLDRIDTFLRDTELLDSFSEPNELGFFCAGAYTSQDIIGFRDAMFSWSNKSYPSGRDFHLRIDQLTFKRGCVNLITGPTGSGKTSLLMALLGEMHFIPLGPDSLVSLPRGCGVAYAAQESWVQNETIRENIVFGAPFDETRYNKVIHQCGLQHDIASLKSGDRTQVGEKGLILSGGQKARITLARAVYSSADILLLDDVLAGLDVLTSKWVVEKCLGGDLLRGRTVLLVTHNMAMTSPVAAFVVTLGPHGRIHSQHVLSDIRTQEYMLAVEVSPDKAAIEKLRDVLDAPLDDGSIQANGKLIVEEEIAEGHVGWPAVNLFVSGMSAQYPLLFWIGVVSAILLEEASYVIQTWYLGFWGSQYEHHPANDVAVSGYVTVYGLLRLLSVIFYSSACILFALGSIRASRSIHKRLMESVLGTTFRWLDITPTSRLIARCTQDIRAVDGPIPEGLSYLIGLTSSMLLKFAAVITWTPLFVAPGIAVALLGWWFGEIYMRAQLSVKREMSNTRSLVLGQFGAVIVGLSSIRAYHAHQSYKRVLLDRIDRYTRTARTFYTLNCWISIRIQGLGGLFTALLACFLVYGQDLALAADVGFSLTMAIGFSSRFLSWVGIFNNFEVNGNSLERIQSYSTIEQEQSPTENASPPAYWPATGDIYVENLSACYFPGGPKVLHNVSFHIRSGERIGIVGRTGSGKSSLALALLRCIFTTGTVCYDGLPTNVLNLDVLRSNITIIPQNPELLAGTLRANLDPFEQYGDVVLNDSLHAAGFYSLQDDIGAGELTLDSPITSGGGNLSVGQRQILALARAIVRKSKLLILDEATSALDYKTDSIIQGALRHKMMADVTLISIAHRLQTVMDADRIMVLDSGRIVEFDNPVELLRHEKSMFSALVDESRDAESLRQMTAVGQAHLITDRIFA